MKYKVTALTPVLVGDGCELSPVDYMVWKDQVNVLDQNRIFKLLARGPRLEGYLTQLRKATKLDFASWGGFAQNFSQRRIAFEHGDAARFWDSAPSESLFIPTFAADYRGPYLPATALKGALRTGLIFSRWNAATMERAAAAIEGDRVPRRIADNLENSAGASQVRVMAAADSDPVPTSSFKIYLTRVASLDTRQAGKAQLVWKVAGRGSVPPQKISDSTPIFAEMAIPGAVFSGEWHLRAFLMNAELSRALGWRSVPDPKNILSAANDFASAQLASHANYAQAAGLQGVAQTVERLRRELEVVKASECACLLCLGWGGGYVSKGGFLGEDQTALQQVLRAVPSIGRSMRDGTVFPKTRHVVFSGGQPASLPGWVKLEIA